MNKPPIPSERNPRRHQENPGEPPANHPTDPAESADVQLQQVYEEEGREVDLELLGMRREPLKNPHRS